MFLIPAFVFIALLFRFVSRCDASPVLSAGGFVSDLARFKKQYKRFE